MCSRQFVDLIDILDAKLTFGVMVGGNLKELKMQRICDLLPECAQSALQIVSWWHYRKDQGITKQ